MRIGTSDARGRAPRQDWGLKLPRTPLAAIAALAALGAAAWVVQACTPAQARASAVPEPADPAPECCTSEGAASPASANGFDVVSLGLGLQYDFDLLPGTPFAGPGEWSAAVGQIDADGTYKSPKSMPPGGLDIVRYQPHQGPVIQTVVALREWPGFEAEPWITVPDGFFSQADWNTGDPMFSLDSRGFVRANPLPDVARREQWAREQWERRDWLAANVPNDGEWHFLRKSTDPPNELAQLRDARDIETINGLIPVPSYIDGAEVTALAIRDGAGPDRPRPRKWKTGPLYDPPDWIGEPCQNGRIRGKGGTKGIAVTWGTEIDPAGRLTVGAGMSADLYRVIGIRVDVGAVIEYAQRSGLYHAWQNFDKYRCVNGRWVYDGSVHCDRFADAVLTRPPWVATFWLGMPGDGAPGSWTPQTCYGIP